MTDQPKPEKDGTPEGYQPPSYIPGQESGEQYRRPAAGYSQPTEPDGTPEGAAAQQPYGQQPYDRRPYDQRPYDDRAKQPYGAGSPARRFSMASRAPRSTPTASRLITACPRSPRA